MGKKNLWLRLGIWLLSLAIFFFYQSKSIFGGDGGDMVAAICVRGVAHPPGYPLYTLLGRLLYFLPFYTPAWRASLLSSIPASLVVVLVYELVFRLTKNRLAGIFGAFTLAFSYLFWLYAEVPEVFSLNNLFLVALIFLTYSLVKNINFQKLAAFSFIAGLSCSHHHFSLWFYPVLAFFIFWYHKKYWSQLKFTRFLCLAGLFFLGLTPYFYDYWAGRAYPPISWVDAGSLSGFLRLVTRAGYGTFLSHGGSLNIGLNTRLFLVEANFLLFKSYFGWLGFVFLALGFLSLFQKEKRAFGLLLSLYLWELIFLFYTGFGLVSSVEVFVVGIFQRFVLPAVILEVIVMSLGLFFLVEKLISFLFSFFKFKLFSPPVLKTLFLLVFLLYPGSLFVKNSPKFYSLKNDQTAENFAKDILSTVPAGAILMLNSDTTLFNTQYVHYCLGERKDVNLIHYSLLASKSYYPVLQKTYPDLELPSAGEENFVSQFLSLNYRQHPVYVNSFDLLKEGYFLPYGLLYRYFPDQKEIASAAAVYEANQKIWANYHDLSQGILSWFEPTTLGDVRRNYYQAAKKLGAFFLKADKQKEAEEYLKKAVFYESKDIEARLQLTGIYGQNHDCQKAEDELLKIVSLIPDASDPYLILEGNARECFKDKAKEEEYHRLYLERKEKIEGSLKDL